MVVVIRFEDLEECFKVGNYIVVLNFNMIEFGVDMFNVVFYDCFV